MGYTCAWYISCEILKGLLVTGLSAHQVNVGSTGSSLAVRIVQERMAKVAALLLHERRSRGADAIHRIRSVLDRQGLLKPVYTFDRFM